MGTALGVTVLAMIVTFFGCFALSSNPDIIRWTCWGTAWYRNETTMTATKFYLGLMEFVVAECTDAEGDDTWQWSCTTVAEKDWADVHEGILYGFPWSAVEECKAQAEGNQVKSLQLYALEQRTTNRKNRFTIPSSGPSPRLRP